MCTKNLHKNKQSKKKIKSEDGGKIEHIAQRPHRPPTLPLWNEMGFTFCYVFVNYVFLVTMEFLARSSPFEATLWNERLASLTDRLTDN
ncbi:hypothetical protein SFRURICE_003715 [Spodoptera frugiperda]|nr:hypothetical protein SFRURICE_003715 [Spodoptera frugiperda]